MSTIVTRAAKGSPLTHAEVDANFTNLNTDKYQSGDSVTFTTLTANSTSEFGRSSANYWQAVGAATTRTPQFVTLGSDTNIPVTFRSKGTGAVNLAPGSSGVNISNGGTVTAITVTANGSSYTSIPSVAISAPTTTNGVQATANTLMFTSAATVASGGTGYTNGDVLTIVGGSRIGGAVGAYTVTGVSGGVITSVSRTSGSGYSELPTNPVSTTGGTGSGATLNIIWVVSGLNITNAGSGYVEQPTVTFSGGGGSGAAAYATVGSGTTVRSLGSTIDFSTPNGVGLRVNSSLVTGTLTDYVEISGGNPTQTGGVYVRPNGATTNSGLYLQAKGTSPISFYSNWSGFISEQLRVAHTASAVNYVQVTGAATGNIPTISAQGSDTNISLSFSSKGTTGAINFWTNNLGAIQFTVSHTASAVNRLNATGAATGVAPVLSAIGTDTNIDLNLTTKGTGAVRFNTGGGEQARISNTASAVNYVQVTGAATNNAPVISAQGSDSNIRLTLQCKGTSDITLMDGGGNTGLRVLRAITSGNTFLDVRRDVDFVDLIASSSVTNGDIRLTPKGTGLVRFGTRTATSDVAITGYLEIKDSGGTTRKLAIIN